MRYCLFLLAMLGAAAPAWAENRAVVIGNADYLHAPDLAGSDTLSLAGVIRKTGFVTAEGVDLPSNEMRGVLDLMARVDDMPGARIVMLSGRFLNDGAETWFMGTEARKPGPLGAARQGVPLGLVMQLMASSEQGAVLLLGTDRQGMPHERGLANGVGPLSAVEGVSVITGPPEATGRALRELAAGRSVKAAVAAVKGLRLLPGADGDAIPVRPSRTVPIPTVEPSDPDRQAWAEAMTLDSVRGYSTYLERFPLGAFASAARERRAGLRLLQQSVPGEMTASPAQIEAALRLSGAQQLQIQRNLAALGIDPGPQDGTIGDQTRHALRIWQRAHRFDPTGYLTADQLAQLRENTATAADPAGDRDFWERSGAKGGIERLRDYLKRYPEGLFAADARRQLASGGQHPLLQSRFRGDSATWRWARRQDSSAAYQIYLDRFPEGAHREEAQLRHDNLLALTEAARLEEAELGLTITARQIIENRLHLAGLEPGLTDGEFTEDTRQALRRYQASRNLRVTGYVSRQTAATLLANGAQPE
ncbi:peptidoglycan-binding protein [Paracoccus aestuariivivens]|uniref:Peptidoglycan binding-like domain-containing protein n=1 Tax=Paracoccus aestuariivivens TaxID=1820333 RepID=A0A6L6J886_9RHOB|nr:peptidoglycan-binding protein [Paracoccus aestuariivivens]MTH78343.1 hypothetical protein [Paracoccus aestuariivivens]